MSDVQAHYEAFPYPERDPADEATRLITGSPSDPLEIDHHIFGGHRDWSKPLRALFAGGGTGDGLIQLAQLLTSVGRPYEFTYIDLSKSSCAVAQARAQIRNLQGITFVTGSLLDAAKYGPFEYIDCCGVLHHLPDPLAGFAALHDAVTSDGGLGFMVYAPYGRTGVYPLQDAFASLLGGLSPQDKLVQAKKIFAKLPDGHSFNCNPHLVDHENSDAGFYDLLLHSQDQAFDVAQLLSTLNKSGWDLASFCQPALYELARYCDVHEGMDANVQMALAEKLNGTIKTHVGYARPIGVPEFKPDMTRVPHLRGASPAQLAQAVSRGKSLPIKRDGETARIRLPKAAAPLIAGINGRRTLAEISRGTNTDPIVFQSLWRPVERALTGWGLLLYSDLLKA